MKTLGIFLLLSTSFALAQKPVHVKATTTKTGEYRQAHERTAPNKTQTDNYSAKGNTNPYTGKAGTRTPKK